MKTFPTVEDYLEIIAGLRDTSGKLSNDWFFGGTPPISLARYDEDVVSNLSMTTANGKPLTQRQADLVCRLVIKYQRQLAKLGVDVEPVNNPTWRVPLRPMDYSLRVISNDDTLV